MTVGEKIKKIRTFRGMTQKHLALESGLGENGDTRIAQYEMGYRIPKIGLLDKIARVLYVDPQNFYTLVPGSPEDIMRTFFWLEEKSPGVINLFPLVRITDRREGNEIVAMYEDSCSWPVRSPVGIYFNGPLDDFMQEWLIRQQELREGRITEDEYFEWKLNWSPSQPAVTSTAQYERKVCIKEE